MSKLERGRIKRALTLSKLGAKIALGQGRASISDEGAVHAELAQLLTEELGQMKGLPMKIGQLLSYMDGVLPKKHQALYREALAVLRVRSNPTESCLRVLQEELGDPAQRFERFDPEPIAAASIGQVYRGRAQGQEVCIKVQYPGVAEATQNDMKNIRGILALMTTLMPNLDTAVLVDDFETRLKEECDYRAEARYQQRFFSIFFGDPRLNIPELLPSFCTDRVLTTAYVQGETFERFLTHASEDQKNLAGLTLFRFAFGALLQHGLFHADPHPGNLIFEPDFGKAGGLTVIDFGCVQPVHEAQRADLIALLNDALAGRNLRAPLRRALGIQGADAQTMNVILQLTEHVLAPILKPQPFRFDPGFGAAIARAVVEAKASLAKRYLSRRGELKLNRDGLMFVVRNLFGLASVWSALEAEGDFRAVLQPLLKPGRAA